MDTIVPVWLWVVFVGFVLAALFVDFIVLARQGAHVVRFKEALNWSLIWIALSFVFNGLLWWAVWETSGSTAAANAKSLEFLTGYLIEKSLAVDNVFVFLMIFTYFSVPPTYQKRVLMIGVIGAIVPKMTKGARITTSTTEGTSCRECTSTAMAIELLPWVPSDSAM